MYGSDHTSHSTGYHHHHHHHQNSMDMNAAAGTGYGYYPNHHHHHYPHQHHISLAQNAELLSGYASIQNNNNNNNNSTPNTTPTSTSSNNSSSMYHPHLYSPAAAEYGITTSNSSPGEQSYYENTDSSVIHSFYNNQTTPTSVDSQQPQHSPSDPPIAQMSTASQINNVVPDTHIISSDNGLSYTNLDYMYGHSPANAMYMQNNDDKSSISIASQAFNSANSPHLADSNIAHSQQHVSTTTMITTASAAAWHSHQQHHHQNAAVNYLDSNSMDAHQMGLNSMSCLQTQAQLNQMRGSVVHGVNGDGHNQQALDGQQQQQTRNTQQPTYKWMQVKRNVPKPQGRSFKSMQIRWTAKNHLRTSCSHNRHDYTETNKCKTIFDKDACVLYLQKVFVLITVSRFFFPVNLSHRFIKQTTKKIFYI